MSNVIDYAWSQFSPAWIKSMGYEGVMRYISHDGSKDLSPQERDNLRAAGLTIGLVFEAQANRAAQGSAAGAQDAMYANARANSLGYPLDCTLWYAVDFDGSVSAVAPYFQGIASVSGRPFAPYGSYYIAEGVPCNGSPWQTVAWSNGKISGRAGLLQNKFAGNYDGNAVLKANYGQWKVEGDDDVLTAEEHQALMDTRQILLNMENAGTITHDEGITLIQTLQSIDAGIKKLVEQQPPAPPQ